MPKWKSVALKRYLPHVLAAAVFLTIAMLLLLRVTWPDKSNLSVGEDFERIDVSMTSHLFALGVADFNDDHLLDIFTTNHDAAALYLQNHGGGDFRDRGFELGLSGNPDFPGSEIAREVAVPDAPAAANGDADPERRRPRRGHGRGGDRPTDDGPSPGASPLAGPGGSRPGSG
jgi:hypothetical protein